MKAIALLSGGLDSTLAVRIILDLGIEVEALKFTSPFCQCDRNGRCYSADVARELHIPIKTFIKGSDYLEIIKKPKYGYGSGLNPCIDCRIYMLKKAKKYAESAGAHFIFTGEVLGQRPMSQHRRALMTIEREAGLHGKLLRPLSAKYLPETEAELQGWVDRKKLLDINGRGRKKQYELARNYNIHTFSCPAGGCLLTDKNFARRMKDLLENESNITIQDVTILKTGRHFRLRKSKIVAGRNKDENDILKKYKKETEYLFEVPYLGSPTVILQNEINEDAIELAAKITAAYSDAVNGYVAVQYGHRMEKLMQVAKPDKESISRYMI